MNELESNLKSLIIEKYDTMKRFCEVINMPWTTLDSILKRGIANSNISNVLKITKELGIDAEKLVDGNICSGCTPFTITARFDRDKNTDIIDKSTAFSQREKTHLKKYIQLHDSNQQKADTYVDQLLSIQKMENDIAAAAHAREDATSEDLAHDVDIMNDDSEWE